MNRLEAHLGRYLVAAAALSLCFAAIVHALSPFLGTRGALTGALPLVGAAGLGLLHRTVSRPPFATLGWLAWILTAAAAWVLVPAPLTVLASQAALLWGARTAWWGRRPLGAAADGFLGLVAIAAFSWAWVHTGSAALALWCWFLAQAATLLLPVSRTGAPVADAAPWGRARRAAEAALARLES